MKPICLVLFSMVILCACETGNDRMNSEYFETPENDTIDINDDNKADFVFTYSDLRMLSGPSNADIIIISMLPIEGNKILYQNEADLLFLEVNDKIEKNDTINKMWTESSQIITHIDVSNGIREEKWPLLSNKPFESYVGIKINTNGTEKIGWLLLEINNHTGEISVIDFELSSASELIIE